MTIVRASHRILGEVKRTLKIVAARLPLRWQQSLKRAYFGRLVRKRRLETSEPEFAMLADLVHEGDWAIDVGANVGCYTLRLSELVGPRGRVVAFEPVPATFELFSANVSLLPNNNCTLLNAAASDSSRLAGIVIPQSDTGLANFYLAQLSSGGPQTALEVLCLRIDSLALPHPVRLVKIDAEGHESSVLRGMTELLARDAPVLIVENNSPEVPTFLAQLGYRATRLLRSSNLLFVHSADQDTSSMLEARAKAGLS